MCQYCGRGFGWDSNPHLQSVFNEKTKRYSRNFSVIWVRNPVSHVKGRTQPACIREQGGQGDLGLRERRHQGTGENCVMRSFNRYVSGISLGRMGLPGKVAYMGYNRNVSRVLAGKPEGKRTPG
jgi:hypothetical protein